MTSHLVHLKHDLPQPVQTTPFIEDLTAGYQGGWYSVISLHGGGSPAAAPHDPARAITKVRQPGKCCDAGCTQPGQPVMVDLPVSIVVKC